MRGRALATTAALAALLTLLPARGDPGGTLADRYVPVAAGTERNLTYFFGPYLIPPGQDANRLTVDVPLSTGFIVAVAPNLIDATTGEEPTEQVAHIHHAHWFRVTTDSQYEYYDDGLSWVFGTGEEKSQGSLDDRAGMDPAGPRYGIFVDGTTPQLLIYMIHNKTSAPLSVYVLLEVTFISGTREEIETAIDREIHPLTGTLWGETRNATKTYPVLSDGYTATGSGIAIASAGHLHPGGQEVAIANLGPGGICTRDADGDGFPGVTILHSRKMDRVPAAWPYSEDYQMGASKFGWRAPIHEGDVLRQFGTYDVGTKVVYDLKGAGTIIPATTLDGLPHAWYQAMSYTGIYVDRLQAPPPMKRNVCAASNYAPWLIGEDTIAAQANGLGPEFFRLGVNEGVLNHAWHAGADPLCGLAGTQYSQPCERPVLARPQGPETNTVTIAGFVYLPGDQAQGALIGYPRLPQGSPLTFLNEDVGINVRHTVTSCRAPCNGDYVANYPLPDGAFDSGKLGNLDPVDGGLTGPDTVPVWTLDTSGLSPGVYTYFCRIHPWMRGGFEVT